MFFPLSATVCFHQAWPNPDQQTPFPSIFVHYITHFLPYPAPPPPFLSLFFRVTVESE